MKYIIYSLIDPLDGQTRYIGKSCRGLKRAKEHFYKYQLKNKCHKNSWIIGLNKNKLKPKIEIVEICDKENLDQREMHWIEFFNSMGCKLTNMTKGGAGGNTGGAYKKHKPVISINANTGETKRYDYVWQTEVDGFSPSKVVSVCKEKRASHKGYYFHYENSKFEKPVKKTMKKILCINKKTGERKEFDSIKQAAQETAYCITSVSNCIRGKQKSSKYEFIKCSPVNKPINIEL